MNEEQVKSMFCDPFYCLPQVHENYQIEHEVFIEEDLWKHCAIKFIEKEGAEEFIDLLIDNLKGNGSHWGQE